MIQKRLGVLQSCYCAISNTSRRGSLAIPLMKRKVKRKTSESEEYKKKTQNLVKVTSLFPEIANLFKFTNLQISNGIDSNKLLFTNKTISDLQANKAFGKVKSLFPCKEMTVNLPASSEGMLLGNVRSPRCGKLKKKKGKGRRKKIKNQHYSSEGLLKSFSRRFHELRLKDYH